VARAIARSAIPVISAVGHEIDFTISDFVADLRAPTPSAAAELLVGNKEAFEEQLRQSGARLTRALKTQTLELRNRLTAVAGSYVFREPQNLVRRLRDRLDALRTAMANDLRDIVQQRSQQVDEFGLRLTHRLELWRGARTQDVRRLEAHLRALSPLAVLERGFSLTRTADGKIIRDAAEAPVGTKLETRLARGTLESEVTKAKKEN
jgi:exodeoxyribonuclease VII large subunit